MKFHVGQKVKYLYDTGYATVKSIDGNKITVEDENGFDATLDASDLVVIHSEAYGKKEISMEDVKPSEETHYRVVDQVLKTGQKRKDVVWEADLHIEELLDSHSTLSNTEILMKQMGEFKSTFRKAKQQNIDKLIVIHGVGEGVLKSEIRTYLDKQEQLEYFDADFSEYGKGATEIVFHPNWQ